MKKTALQKVEEIAKKIADELGYQLYGVRAYMEDGTEFLEVSVDKDYAITLDQITVYSDALSLKLDEVEELDSPYTLDVTSPGAERDFPKEDLEKVIGYYRCQGCQYERKRSVWNFGKLRWNDCGA